MLRPGEVFSGYVIDRTLGRGGSATVYLAHRPSEPAVALKVLADDHTPEAVERLRREFSIADGLHHRHIVTVSSQGPGWLAMQYASGGNITALNSPGDVLAALAQIADALDDAHRHGVVHCDVKPANILLAKPLPEVDAVLIDFGVAHLIGDPADPRAGHSGHIQASLPYVAPELLTGEMPSPATDEYELACTTVDLITGAPPFSTATAVGLIDAHLHHQPPRVSHHYRWLPTAFDSVLAKAMAKRPEHRYDSCSEFVRLISRIML